MSKLTRLAIRMTLPLSCAHFASIVVASTATATFPVTVRVVDSCTVAASPLSFGAYNGIVGGTVDAVAMITPSCTAGTAYAVALSAGQGNGATLTSRVFTGPSGANLNYGIYTDPSRLKSWGDGSGGTGSRVGSGTGIPQPVMMYGRIPAGQTAKAGTYADTITVTLTY